MQEHYWSCIHFVWLIFPSTKIWRARKTAPPLENRAVNLLEKLRHTTRLHALKESVRNKKTIPLQVLSNSRARKFQQLSKILCEPSEILWNLCAPFLQVCISIFIYKKTHSVLIYYFWHTLSQGFIYFCSLHCRHGDHPGQDTDHHILSGHPEN